VSISNNSKKVFIGVIFDVYHWEQEMFDGSTEVFEKLKRPDTSEVIAVTKDKKIILIRQDQPDISFIGLPGGRVGSKESPAEGARRELMEETGYAPDTFMHWFSSSPFRKIEWSLHYFIAKNCEIAGSPENDAGEKIEVMLVSFDEFIQIASQPKFRSKEITDKILRCRLDKSLMKEFKELTLA
jgi:ADP-ribose pyrophosphatase